MARVYISTCDPIHLDVMTEKECNDTFGDEFIEDFGKIIPDELLQEYKQAYKIFWDVQEKLRPYNK